MIKRLGFDRTIAFVITAIIVFGIEYMIVNESPIQTKVFELQLVLCYSFVQVSSIRKFGTYNLFTLFMVGMFFFAVGGFFHFLITDDNPLELMNGYGTFFFTHSIIQRSILIYSLFIILSFFIYSKVFDPSLTYSFKTKPTEFEEKCLKIGKFLMWAFLWIEIYKGYLFFNSFSADRVLIFLYGNMSNPVPTWVRFFATFFEVGYGFIICSKPDAKVFKKYSALYFILLIPDIAIGNRAMFGGFILFCLWYYARCYNPRPIKTKYFIIFGVFMLLVFQGMGILRDGMTLREGSFSPTEFLKGQAVSFYLLPLYMQNQGAIQYYLYPFVLYPILGGFTGYTGQSIEVLEHNCGVGHQLMYALNPDYYLSGASLGTSSMTELYDLGLWGIVIGALFYPIMLHFFEKRFSTSKFWLFMSMMLVTKIIMSPRASYFPDLYSIVKEYLFYTFALVVFGFLSKRHKTL